ncbi:Uncharacterised protein [Bordetella pertussis]|nr:Uncharacterised protein [Bordetella pertussis]
MAVASRPTRPAWMPWRRRSSSTASTICRTGTLADCASCGYQT